MNQFLKLNMSRQFRGAALLCAVFAASQLVAGCAGAPEVNGVDVAKAEVPRETAPDVPQADIDSVVSAHQAFSFAMYQRLAAGEGNIVSSPYSIATALSMVYGGARSNTAGQMSQVLHNDLPQEQLHPALNALDQTLTGRAVSDDPAKPNFELNVANAVWGERSMTFNPDYLDLLASNYGAGVRLADFTGAPEPARQTINQWVSDKTNGKIKDLFAPGVIDNQTRMVLVNAIYFLGKWAQAFDPAMTTDREFTLLDGSKVMVPMMSNSEVGATYGEGEGYQAIRLPYRGARDTLAMLIILPGEGQFAGFEQRLDEKVYNEVLDGMFHRTVMLDMPRFKIESSFGLADQLKAMGMTDAFDPALADFSGIGSPDAGENLYISAVLHKAYIDVTEEGTEAAAATGIVVGVTSLQPDESPVMKIDRPFIFAIYDTGTREILFLGRVLDPR